MIIWLENILHDFLVSQRDINGTSLDYELRILTLLALDHFRLPEEFLSEQADYIAYWARDYPKGYPQKYGPELDAIFEEYQAKDHSIDPAKRVRNILWQVAVSDESSDEEVFYHRIDLFAMIFNDNSDTPEANARPQQCFFELFELKTRDEWIMDHGVCFMCGLIARLRTKEGQNELVEKMSL